MPHRTWYLASGRAPTDTAVVGAVTTVGAVSALLWLAVSHPPFAAIGALAALLGLADRALAIPPLTPIAELPPDPHRSTPSAADTDRARVRLAWSVVALCSAGGVVWLAADQALAALGERGAWPTIGAALVGLAVACRAGLLVARRHALAHGDIWTWDDQLAVVAHGTGAWVVPYDAIGVIAYHHALPLDKAHLTLTAEGDRLRLAGSSQLPRLIGHLRRHAIPRMVDICHRHLMRGEELRQERGDRVDALMLGLALMGYIVVGSMALSVTPMFFRSPLQAVLLVGLTHVALLSALLALIRHARRPLCWSREGLRLGGKPMVPWCDISHARVFGDRLVLVVDAQRRLAFRLHADNALVALDLLEDFVRGPLPRWPPAPEKPTALLPVAEPPPSRPASSWRNAPASDLPIQD